MTPLTVILSIIASNEFFIQFPNCLAYESLEDCAKKVQFALANTPEPLNEKFKRILSWEGMYNVRIYFLFTSMHNRTDKQQQRSSHNLVGFIRRNREIV